MGDVEGCISKLDGMNMESSGHIQQQLFDICAEQLEVEKDISQQLQNEVPPNLVHAKRQQLVSRGWRHTVER